MAVDYATRARKKALKYARKELELDIICDGEVSPVVREALRYIRALEEVGVAN